MSNLALEWRDGIVRVLRTNAIGIPISGAQVALISTTKDGIQISCFEPEKKEIKQTLEQIEIKLI